MSLDPSIIERYAKLMELKAGSRVARFTLMGLALGGFLGSMPLLAGKIHLVHSAIPSQFGYGMTLAAAAGGAYLGYLVGQSRAVALRLQAHVAVHQLEVERLIRRLDGMAIPLPAIDPAVLAPAQVAPEAEPEPAPAVFAPPPPPVVPPPVPFPVPETAPAPAPAALAPAPFSFPPASPPPAQAPAATAPAPVPPPVPFAVPVSEHAPVTEPLPSPAPVHPFPVPVSFPAPEPVPSPGPEPEQELEPPAVHLAPPPAAPDWQLPPVNAVRTNP